MTNLTKTEQKYVEERVKVKYSSVVCDILTAYREMGEDEPEGSTLAAESIMCMIHFYTKAYKQWIKRADVYLNKKHYKLYDITLKKAHMAQYARLYCVTMHLPK